MKEKFYDFHSSIPVINEVDVAVIGGGTAGVFAAISSGIQGAKTLLIEKTGKLGGTVTSGGVNFPGLFHAWGKQIISGPCWDAIKRAAEPDNIQMPDFTQIPQHHWQHQITVNIFTYCAVLDKMCAESGVEVMLHTVLAFARETDGGLLIICGTKEGLRCVKAKIAIDATGDANLTGILGYPRVRSEVLQPATLINNISGYDLKSIDRRDFNDYTAKAVAAGILAEKDTQGHSLYSQLEMKRLAMHITDVDGSTSAGKTAAEFAARKTLEKVLGFIKAYPGLENTFVSYFAEECGIRETFRIVAERNITSDEYLRGHLYPDAVCHAFYPIDLHVSANIKQIFLEEGVVPTIPYGALIPQNAERLLAAGRCIGGDTDSNSAYRVQAPCMATGQAAGTAAALAAKSGISVKAVPYPVLCRELKNIGAIVPEFSPE